MSLKNLASNLELLDLIEDKEERTMDAIEFGWMSDDELVELAMNHNKVDTLDGEQRHDLIRELAGRLQEHVYMRDSLEN